MTRQRVAAAIRKRPTIGIVPTVDNPDHRPGLLLAPAAVFRVGQRGSVSPRKVACRSAAGAEHFLSKAYSS
jgi:hypothetical protein